MSTLFIKWFVIIFGLFICRVLADDGGYIVLYRPYNITFNATAFKWYEGGYRINVPEYERISFVYTSSSLDPVTEIKYGVRILSHVDNTPVQRPIYLNKNDGMKRVSLNLTGIRAFNIVIRGLVKIPDRITMDASISVWSTQDTDILYTGYLQAN
jgi:hypothetical protein